MGPTTMDKPQGFNEGKLAKQGIFTCSWGCGKKFLSMEDAKYHWETETCEGKETSDRTVEKLHSIARSKARLGKPYLEPLKIWGRNDVANPTNRAWKRFEEGTKKRVKTFEEDLKTLPESDAMLDVEHWVLTSPFHTGFS